MFERMKLRKDNFVENIQAGDKVARRWLIIYCGIALFIIIGLFGLIRLKTGYKSFEVLKVTDKKDDVSVNYQVIGDGLIRYSKDGALFTDKNGKELWNQPFEMANAQVASSDDYMVIGDIGSNQIRVFNQAGQIAMINAIYPVVNVEVAKTGVVAAILSDSKDHFINLYDSTGSELVKIKATLTNTGYPIDLALSEDGTKLAVSYLVVSGGDVTTQLVFYRFGKTVKENESNIIGTYNYQEIYPKIDFINNNTMVAFGEAGFNIYSVKDAEPNIVLEKAFENNIKSIFYNEQYIGFVFRNEGISETDEETEGIQSTLESGMPGMLTADAVSNPFELVAQAVDESESSESDEETESIEETESTEESAEETAESNEMDETEDLSDVTMPIGTPHETETEFETTDGIYPSLNDQEAETAEGSGVNENSPYRYKMLVYTNSGKLYLDKEFDFNYHYVECSNDEIIMYNDNECLMIEYSGREKFRYTFEERINSLLPKKSRNEYIIIDDNTIKEIRLR